jgi:hypothetical protein
VDAEELDEEAFFQAIAKSGVRSLLIGRRALIVLGAPVLTSDYDLWIHIEDIAKLNDALRPLDFRPSHTPEQARGRGRYVLEGPERVDVLVARAASTKDGVRLAFDDAWARRQTVRYSASVELVLPSVDDLILTKRWSMRERDMPDIQFLEALRTKGVS